MPGLSVTVDFEDVGDYDTDYFHRSITLSHPNWEIFIGRSTSSSQGQKESANNALFSSRVVSREHAKLRADPETRLVTIEDVGSLHGTHLQGRRLQPGRPEPLYRGARVVFGAEVDRIEQGTSMTFKPKEVEIYCHWSDEGYAYDQQPETHQPLPRNSFSADYSDDEPATPYDSDEGYQPRSPSVVDITRTFTVPYESSDVSDEVISIHSDQDVNDAQSPTSSPVGSLDLADNPATKTTETRAVPASKIEFYQGPIDISEDDSYYEDSSIFDADEEDGDGPHSPVEPHQNITVEIPGVRPREPSPSDAAMVKPAPTARSPPFSQQLPSITELQPAPGDAGSVQSSFSSCGRYQSAWAGHNSILYEPTPASPMNPRTEGTFGFEPFRGISQAIPLQYMTSVQPASWGSAPEHPTAKNFDFSAYSNAPAMVFTDDVIDEIPELAAQNLPEIVGEDVVEDDDDEDDDEVYGHGYTVPTTTISAVNNEAAEQFKPRRKRRADEMAADEPATINSIDSLLINNTTAAMSEPVLQINPSQLAESIKSPPPANTSVESPTKKAKRSKEDRGARPAKKGSTFAQLAATAFAGVAIGAVGAVYGLASLPADFFA